MYVKLLNLLANIQQTLFLDYQFPPFILLSCTMYGNTLLNLFQQWNMADATKETTEPIYVQSN